MCLLIGSYSRQSTSSLQKIFIGILPGWAASLPIALLLRGLLKGSGDGGGGAILVVPPVPFIIVSMIATFVLLTIGRCLFILSVGSTSDEEYKSAGFFEVFKMVGTLIKRW